MRQRKRHRDLENDAHDGRSTGADNKLHYPSTLREGGMLSSIQRESSGGAREATSVGASSAFTRAANIATTLATSSRSLSAISVEGTLSLVAFNEASP